MKHIKSIAAIMAITLVLLSLAACGLSKPQSEQLIASWRDSKGLSGYEFHEGGTVTITYVDVVIPVLNIPFNGTITGAYETSETEDTNFVTVKYSIFSKTVEKMYEYHVDKDVLTIIDPETHEESVYMRYEKQPDPTTEATEKNKETKAESDETTDEVTEEIKETKKSKEEKQAKEVKENKEDVKEKTTITEKGADTEKTK